jgi:hypothetical protein
MEGSNAVRLSSGSLADYFVECVDEAVAAQGIEIDDHVRAYLVNLLTSFAQRKALITEDLDDLLSEPIAIQVLKAMQATPSKRFQLLRQVGDFSLYIVGFFSESFDRSIVDSSYYCDMGAGAYKHAADTLRHGGLDNPFRQLYGRLAVRFREIADLLNGVSERCFHQDSDILRLYDRFLTTGSRRVAARLAQLGVAVGAEPKLAQ